jgi:anion-transporting  ArsA/GET3 family ATPase
MLSQKLWLVTGKGGVGKTTLAGALGLYSASLGADTLVVETHGLNHLGDLLGKPKTEYRPRRIQKKLWLAQINAEEALEEYLLQQIKIKTIYNAVFKNKYVRHFMDAAPGLVELLTIGKIWALTRGKGHYGNKRSFDRVIVDAPSTGHGLSLLTVPEVVAQAVRVGPLKTKSEQILDLIRDETKTMVWLATLAEDMPVAEATEMATTLKEKVRVALGPILVNGLWPDLISEASQKKLAEWKEMPPLVASYRSRFELSRFYLDKLKTNLSGNQFWEIPLIYDVTSPLEITSEISERLGNYFAGRNHGD